MLSSSTHAIPAVPFIFAAVVGGLALALSAALAPPATGGSSGGGRSGEPARTVLITGANRGIGLEFARQYHAAGWSVIGTAREPDAAKELKAIGDGVEVLALDVASGESVAALSKTLGGRTIDLLINNAGVGIDSGGGPGLADIKIDEFERIMRVNAIGPVRVTQALLPNLRAGKGRMVVGISSGLGSIGDNRNGGFYGYRESKASLDMFTRSIAAELKPEGFICIAMAPGWVKTDMGGKNAQLTPEQSITGMRKVIDSLKPDDSGKFWHYDGSNLAW